MTDIQAMACELRARTRLHLGRTEQPLSLYRAHPGQPDPVQSAVAIAAETARAYGCIPGGFLRDGELSVMAEAWRQNGQGGEELVASAEVWRSRAPQASNDAACLAFLAAVSMGR